MADLPFTLDQLRILRAIASEGSFKKAADSLYVTQPAVSLQIQNLEKQLDVSLFDRGGRKAQLTEAGHLLLSYCDRILSQCQEACRALDDLHNLRGGSLVVGASQTTGTYLMPRMIGLFRQKYPDVAVQLQVHSTRRTGWSVANGQIDLAIIGGELPADLNDLLQVVPYANDELALVLPPSTRSPACPSSPRTTSTASASSVSTPSPPPARWSTSCSAAPSSTCSGSRSRWS